MFGNDVLNPVVEEGRCIAIDANDLRSIAHWRAGNKVFQKASLNGKCQSACDDMLLYDISNICCLTYASPFVFIC